MNDEGQYRIQVVSERTGVSAATLRAWERRYGVPVPRRASSAYRIYTDKDIATIKELLRLRESGLSMAEAARRVRDEAVTEVVEEVTTSMETDDPFVDVRAKMVDAVRRFDPDELERVLSSVMFTGRVSMVFDRVLAPVMQEVGDLWHKGEISVGQEHMATFLLEGAMRNMLRMLEFAEDARPVILGCVETEEHSLPVFGVAFHLARWGYRPVMMGARTPAAALKSAVEGMSPALVGLSMTVNPPRHRLRELVESYVVTCKPVPVLFGGPAAFELREQIESLGGLVPAENTIDSVRAAIDAAAGRSRN